MGGRRGRGNRSRTQRKHFRDGRENVWKRPKSDSSATDPANGTGDNPTWQPFATENLAFDEYYKGQGIVSPDEWDTFAEVIRKPLPAAFRINSSSQFCTDIRLQLENDFMKSLQAEVTDGDEVDAIRPLPWYPHNLAWHSNFSRMELRKNQTLERFHEFLKLENEIGNITRQEAVSMVPPLFLDVHPDHFVLDMCAAPGSKTFQLLEIIYQSVKSGSLPDGMVIANDLDIQRCNLLIHQTKRMCTANLIVTNNEAQHFPGCRTNKNCISDIESKPPISQLLFDRVLCDVPCSGDGTLRKAPDLWRKWNSGMGNGLHVLQLQIAMRGLSLLKVGGRMVYSTCSMNPVENEAVVAEILRKCGGSVELVDVSNELPQLVRRPGLRKWKVRDKGIWLSSHKDVSKFRRYGILPSMFPSGRCYVTPSESDHKHENGGAKTSEDEPMEVPTTLIDDSNEEVSDLPLERCMRLVPHDQNSGAFFIAVLHKLSPLPVIPEKPSRRANFLNKKRELQRKSSDQVTEGNNGMELNSEDAAAERISEATSEAEIENELDNTPAETGISEATPEAEIENELDNTPAETRISEATPEAEIENELDDTPAETVPSNACGENELEKEPTNEGDIQSSKAVGKRKLQIQGKWKGVDPVLFFRDEAIINSIKAFYGIDESFSFDGHLISRNIDNNHVKRIYYVSKSVKDVLELNLLVGQQLKIASTGLKMFERQTSREGTSTLCAFRISSEGLPVILPHITKQILCASPVDFKHLLQDKSIKYTDFADAEFGEKASNLQMGCCVIVLGDGKNPSDPIKVDASTIAIGCWKGRNSLSVMVTAIDCQELLERLSTRMGTKTTSMQENAVEANEVHNDINGIENVQESENIKQATDI